MTPDNPDLRARANAIMIDVLMNHLPRVKEGFEKGYPDENQILVMYDHAVRARLLMEAAALPPCSSAPPPHKRRFFGEDGAGAIDRETGDTERGQWRDTPPTGQGFTQICKQCGRGIGQRSVPLCDNCQIENQN